VNLPAIDPGDSNGYFLGKELGHTRLILQVLKSQLFLLKAEH
jgi:hypothetical protein